MTNDQQGRPRLKDEDFYPMLRFYYKAGVTAFSGDDVLTTKAFLIEEAQRRGFPNLIQAHTRALRLLTDQAVTRAKAAQERTERHRRAISHHDF